VEGLRDALSTRDVIGQAKGILMATRKVDADAAFDLLRVASQALNVKLRTVAEEVARTGALPSSPPT
jgi:AmiR/NasT family two-component response regulator